MGMEKRDGNEKLAEILYGYFGGNIVFTGGCIGRGCCGNFYRREDDFHISQGYGRCRDAGSADWNFCCGGRGGRNATGCSHTGENADSD